jgi:hypothetical protein
VLCFSGLCIVSYFYLKGEILITYYSNGSDEIVHELDHYEDELYELMSEEENVIDFIELEEMELMKGKFDQRWCTYYVCPISNGDCGKSQCGEYEPSNGRRGKCRYKTFAYECTGKKFVLSKDGLKEI